MSSRDEANNAINNDKMIQDLAIYEVSKGGLKALEKDRDMEVIQHRFSEYKSLIMRGEMTFDELETRILGKWGITEPLVPMIDPNMPAFARANRGLPLTEEQKSAEADNNLHNFLDEIAGILKEETKKGMDPVEEPAEEPQEPYPLHKRIWDRIRLICSRFYVNI